MFIKEVERPNGSFSIRVVESVRRGKHIKQKVVRIIGQGKKDFELKALRDLASQTIAHIENERHPLLPIFKPEEFYGINSVKKAVPDSVKLNEVKEEKRVNEGIGDIFGSICSQLNLDKLIQDTRKDEQWNDILTSCVLARIADPVSKRDTAKNLALDYAIDIPLEKIYRMMDHVATREDFIKSAVINKTLELQKQKVDVMFFDVTTLYFESFEGDELRNFGFSKDCKFKETQVVLALVTSSEGLPITYELFPGNMYEGKTLIKMIKNLKKNFNVENVMLVADRAMFTESNLSLMEEEKINYVVAAKLKMLPKKMKDQILNDDFSPGVVNNELQWVKEYDHNSRRLIVAYSSKRAKKDFADRNRLVERIIKKAKDGTVMVKDLITNSGSKKYVKVLDNEAKINHAKISGDSLWDGLHGVISNVPDKTKLELLEKYRGLWKIEEAFRINKHDLKMRPIFHWKPARIKAHIGICFLAYAVVSYTMKKLENQKIQMSFDHVRNLLLRVESSIVRDQKTKNLYGIPSSMNEEQKIIYKAFKIERSDRPHAL